MMNQRTQLCEIDSVIYVMTLEPSVAVLASIDGQRQTSNRRSIEASNRNIVVRSFQKKQNEKTNQSIQIQTFDRRSFRRSTYRRRSCGAGDATLELALVLAAVDADVCCSMTMMQSAKCCCGTRRRRWIDSFVASHQTRDKRTKQIKRNRVLARTVGNTTPPSTH